MNEAGNNQYNSAETVPSKMAGEVIAEAVSMLMDAGVHPVEIRKHLQTETAWIDREMAQVDAPTWSA